MNEHPGKNLSLCFSKVAVTKNFGSFCILYLLATVEFRAVLFILDTNYTTFLDNSSVPCPMERALVNTTGDPSLGRGRSDSTR